VADAAFAGIIEGRDVLVMAPTNAIVEQLNTTITQRLLDTGHLDPDQQIDIGDCVFYPDQAVVTRANDRRLTYGTDGEEWVRNGDRWQINSSNYDELHLTNADTGHRTRGRVANHIHTAPPAFDPDQHGPDNSASEWTPQGTVAAALARQPDDVSALERRRPLRELHTPVPPEHCTDMGHVKVDQGLSDVASEGAAAATKRLQSFNRRRSEGVQR